MDKALIASTLRGTALLAFLTAATCAHPVQPSARPRGAEAARQFADEAARQVRRCYRSPRVASVGRQIVTEIRARYAADGSLIGLPVIVMQSGVTPQNSSYAGRMADAARLAVIRCAPLRIPPKFTRRPWYELEIVFSPRMRA